MIESMIDLRQLLKGFGIFIYTGDVLGDLELMEDELKELQENNLLETEDYMKALLIIRAEKNKHTKK